MYKPNSLTSKCNWFNQYKCCYKWFTFLISWCLLFFINTGSCHLMVEGVVTLYLRLSIHHFFLIYCNCKNRLWTIKKTMLNFGLITRFNVDGDTHFSLASTIRDLTYSYTISFQEAIQTITAISLVYSNIIVLSLGCNLHSSTQTILCINLTFLIRLDC